MANIAIERRLPDEAEKVEFEYLDSRRRSGVDVGRMALFGSRIAP
jgi:TnpA family transposase